MGGKDGREVEGWRVEGWRVEGGGWKMNDVGIEGGEIYRRSCFYLGGQNRQLCRYKMTCVANV